MNFKIGETVLYCPSNSEPIQVKIEFIDNNQITAIITKKCSITADYTNFKKL